MKKKRRKQMTILGPDPGAVPGSKIEPLPGKPGWYTEIWSERDQVKDPEKAKKEWLDNFNKILESIKL